MDSREAASMFALILTGTPKEEAAKKYGKDPEFSGLWDEFTEEVERKRAANPKVQFDVPSEMPDFISDPTLPQGGSADTPAEPNAPSDGAAVENLRKKVAETEPED